MKNLKILLSLTFIFACAATAFSQMKYSGTVVDVVDGKTVVIELPTHNKLTAQLQFIEVPEPEQELHQVVKDHLQKLLLGKPVEFLANQMMRTKTVGQLTSGGVDVSQQMLRDGAAWYYSPVENQSYKNIEAQAKLEKRGVWSIATLIPAWEYRAEKERLANPPKPVVEETVKPEPVADNKLRNLRPRPSYNTTMWADVTDYSSIKESTYDSGLVTAFVPKNDIGYISTPDFDLPTPNGDNLQKAIYRLGYFYKGSVPTNGNDSYMLMLQSQSKKWAFAESNNLVMTADGREFSIGKINRVYEAGKSFVQEVMFYRINRDTLVKIAAAKKLEVRFGKYTSPATAKFQKMLRTLLKDTAE